MPVVFNFKETDKLFSEVTLPVLFPTSKYSTSSEHLVFSVFFHLTHSVRCIVVSHCGVNLHFPLTITNDVDYLLFCLVAFHTSSLVKYLFASFAPLLSGYFLIIEFWEFFIFPGYKYFVRYLIEFSVPVYGLSFHSLNGVFFSRVGVFLFCFDEI